MQTGTFEKVGGTVEVDETFIGGKARNMHRADVPRKIHQQPNKGKSIVVGARSRDGQVRASVVANPQQDTLQPYVRENVEAGATVYTEAHSGYTGLEGDYEHRTVDHATHYVDGQVHSNGIENFWSLLKRGLHGTYISVRPFHLFRYLDERVFTYNHREADDLGRFSTVVEMVSGRRLTWTEVIGKP